ncbi:MAG TPA: dephospho-CoA kinase [Bacteroidales bacterium]|nr:dephospho-CoA kinase [Bacteroidales bacterium]
MLKIGLTGGIGSGKSLVAKIFLDLEVPVYPADERAKSIYNTNDSVKREIINLLGQSVYQDNKINRKKLAALIFRNKNLLEKVNQIVHPAVRGDFEDWCRQYTDKKYVLQEAAILFESGSNKHMDYIISVDAPVEVRIKRVMDRDGMPREQVLERINHQMEDKERNELSDFIIYNDGTRLLLPQVLEIHQKIKEIA